MPHLRISQRQAPRRRGLFWWAALWLAVGASLVSACTLVPTAQNQPQHAEAPRHTLYVSYWHTQKPVKAPGDALDNPFAFIVAAMSTGDGKKSWQTTLLDSLGVGKVNPSPGGSARYYTLVSGPVVYVAASFGGTGVVAALDAYTGKILWKHDGVTDPIYAVQAANGVLYLQLGQNYLQALDGSNGQLLWKLSTGGYYSLGSIALAGQAVYIVEQSFGPERLGDPDPATYYFVRALRARAGTEIWRGSVEKTMNTVGYDLQADDQRVYLLKPSYSTGVANLPGTVTALRASDGSALWTYTETHVDVGGDFALFAHADTVVGQTLYLIAHKRLTALDAPTGTLRLSYATPFSLYRFTPPDRLYGAGNGRDEAFCSVNITDGTKQWCTPAEPVSQIIVGTENLYFLGYSGSEAKVMVMGQGDGHVVAQYQIDDPTQTFPGDFAGED